MTPLLVASNGLLSGGVSLAIATRGFLSQDAGPDIAGLRLYMTSPITLVKQLVSRIH